MKRFLIVFLAVLFGCVGAAFATKPRVVHPLAGSDPVLLGDSTLESFSDSNGATQAQAWPYTATVTGTTTDIEFYDDSHQASTVHVGLYSDASGRPGTLLASASVASPTVGAWHDFSIPSVAITAGTKYWLAVAGAGFRDNPSGSCTTVGNSKGGITSTWANAFSVAGYCPASFYVDGTATGTTTSTSTTTSSTTTTPPPPSGSVGVGGAPTPTCSTTVAVNGDVASAVSAAVGGSTVCLASGNWSTIDLGASSNAVTLASATPGGAVVNGLHTDSPVSNLTVEGLSLTDGIFVLETASNVTLEYNTLENWSASDAQSDPAFFVNSDGVVMSYNQIDHVPQCLQDDSPSGGNTFSHNVCGPDIGEGGSPDVHYTQSDGVNNEVIDNNAFEGPLAPGAGGHINVSHMAGNNDQFNNNILWHVDGDQHLQWNDDYASTNLEANNNLDIEDPAESSGAFEQIANNYSLSGLTNDNNTVIGASGETANDYEVEPSPSSCNVANNIGVGNPNGAFDVAASCTTSNNVTTVSSWQSTSWTPTDGSPWIAPPAGYYQPTGGSSAGYQGTVGP
jgi:hypothetical protein